MYSNEHNLCDYSLTPAEPFGLESFDLEPNRVNKYVIEFVNRGTKLQ